MNRDETNHAEPEVYPPEALADEEPRYLRRQKPLEIRRRKFGRRNWPAYRRWLLAGPASSPGGCLAYGGVRFFLFSPRVALASEDQIEVTGNRYVSPRPRSPRSSRRISAGASCRFRSKRAAPRSRPFPGSRRPASNAPFPNRLRVELTERTPVAFLRAGNQLALVDESGVILDRPLEGDFHFPVAIGFDETMPRRRSREAHAPVRRVHERD